MFSHHRSPCMPHASVETDTWQQTNMTIHEMIQKIYTRGKTAGTGGIQVNDYGNVNKTIELGARFLTLSTSGLLLQGTKTFLSNIK